MRFTVFILLFFIGFSLIAQSPFYIKYDLENGCPTNNLYDVNQGPNGYVWIAGEEGIARFDGKTFIAVGDDQVDATNLINGKGNTIWAIAFDNTLLRIENDSASVELNWNSRHKNESFTFVYNEVKNLIWLSSSNGYLYRYAPEIQQLDSFMTPPLTIPGFEVPSYGTAVVPQGVIGNKTFLGILGYGLHSFDNQTNEFQKLQLAPEIDPYSITFGIFYQFQEKTYWIETSVLKNNVIYELKGNQLIKNKTWSKNLITNRVVRAKPTANQVILSTPNGVFVFNADGTLKNGKPLLTDYFCTNLVVDHEENWWVSTLKDGLLFLPNPNINYYTQDNSFISESSIDKLAQKDNRLFLSTMRRNIYSLDEDKKFKRIYSNTDQVELETMLKIGPNGFLYFDKAPKTLIIDPSTSKVLFHKTIGGGNFDIEFYKDRLILSCSRNASIADNPIKKTNTPFPNFSSGGYILNNLRVKNLASQRSIGSAINPKDSSLWIAQRGVLLRLSETNGRDTIQFQNQNIAAYALEADTYNGVWVSSRKGVYLFAGDSVVQHFRFPEQLLDDEVFVLRCIGDHLYMCSKNGLQQYHLKSKEWKNFQKQDGIHSNLFKDVEETNDYIYASTAKGLIEIPKKVNPYNPVLPKIILDRLIINEEDTLHSSLDDLEFTHQKNNLQFHLNALSYKSQGKYQIHYQLEGIDKNWIKSEEEYPIARYSKLRHGEYNLKAKAVNEDGVFSEEIHLSFKIFPAFWQTLWFYGLCLLAIAYLIYYLVKLRIKQLKQRSEIEKKMINSEITALKSQMNPHFIFNALNSIQDLIMKQEMRNSNIYLGKFASLLRLVLTNSSKEKINLYKEVEMLQTYLDLETLRFYEDFSATIEIDPTLDPENVFLPPMIVQPYAENAVKHGLLHREGEKELTILFKQEGKIVYCYIRDNGIGRKASNQINTRRQKYHLPFAQEANEKRIDLINAVSNEKVSLEITDLNPGTEVKIGFPQSHFES